MSTENDSSTPLAAMSVENKSTSGVGCLYAAVGVFVLVGGVSVYFFFARPLKELVDARHWATVACEILSSEVKTYRDSKGKATYGPDIRFVYEFQGQRREADRYSIVAVRSNNFQSHKKVVDQFPRGTKTVCFVNPNDAATAVLNRDFLPQIWFGLIPLVFVCVGIGAALFVRSRTTAASETTSSSFASGAPAQKDFDAIAAAKLPSDIGAGPVVLRPTTSPLMKFIMSVFVAAFWNGIVGFFIYLGINEMKGGGWFVLAFMVPFSLVGLLLIWMVGYTFLGLFSPKPTLRLNSGILRLGDTLDIQWEFSGQTTALQRLHIVLHGEETSTYRRGTTTCTERSTFAELPIIDTTAIGDIAAGRASLAIPSDTMHSWDVGANNITWTLRVHGEIRRWPDVCETYPFVILPREFA